MWKFKPNCTTFLLNKIFIRVLILFYAPHLTLIFSFRERQSPKEVAKKSDVKSPKIMETKTSKPSLDSEFDLLSLNKPNKTNSGPVVPEESKSSVTDLLGLGGKSVL